MFLSRPVGVEKTKKFQIPELEPQTTYVMSTTPVSVKKRRMRRSVGDSEVFPRQIHVFPQLDREGQENDMKIVNQEMTRFNEDNSGQ